ncbi:hypothetical protein G5714_009300 [Onychostoma macrolepis]|uniref:Uncharacterized protein n=1 Tax=Onychostoma macrolepis TaxID=369639 RepID=A0A7J6CRT6_9TELE|nr:hypothetical protein G5714_009300 [Onychostoma macrolepis]
MPFRFIFVFLGDDSPQFAPETASKIPEQTNQSEDGPFFMFTIQKTLPLQSHMTRKVPNISAQLPLHCRQAEG